jgi:hypothetical protein
MVERFNFECRRTGIELDASENEEGIYVLYEDYQALLESARRLIVRANAPDREWTEQFRKFMKETDQ